MGQVSSAWFHDGNVAHAWEKKGRDGDICSIQAKKSLGGLYGILGKKATGYYMRERLVVVFTAFIII